MFQPTRPRPGSPVCSPAIVMRVASGAVLVLGVLTGGCQSSPRTDVDSARAIADATGLAAPVDFKVVGPDGGPLDEPDPVGATLTLAEAVRRAVTTDPGLQAAMARVRVAVADSDQARLLPNPVLNVILRWGPGKPQVEASLAQDFVRALQLPRRADAADNRLRQVAAGGGSR
jgi:outer membrane protein, heavy metal efflux system